MNFRELLQYEIWSEETSRKILLGIAIGIAIILAIAAAEMFWVTPGERALGSAVLAQIDGLQRLDPESGQFDSESKNDEKMVALAARAAFTVRDRRIASSLAGYLMIVELEPGDLKVRRSMEQFEKTHPGKVHSDPAFDAERDAENIEVRRYLSSTLHSALDYNASDF